MSAIGHPTGRLIGERDAYAVDMEAMMREAAQYGVALELNAYPQRLDLSDGMLRMAKEHGAPIMINTDAHLTGQFENMTYGVSMARRGWIEKKDVVNALPLEQLMRRLRAMREGKLKTVQRLGAVPAGSRGRAGKRKA